MSAARSPRVICGAPSIARYSAGSRASSARARTRLELAPRRPSFGSIASASAYALTAPSKSPRGLEHLADLRQRPRVGRIERDRLAEVLQRRRRCAPADARRRRARDTGTRCRASWRSRACSARSPRRGGRPAPPRRARLRRPARAAEPQHLDPPRRSGQRRIDGQRRLERGQRVGLPVRAPSSAWPRPTSADRSLGLPLERPIEVRQRRLRILAAPARHSPARSRPDRTPAPSSAPLTNSRSAFFRSPACRNAQPRVLACRGRLSGERRAERPARMNSGNFGAVDRRHRAAWRHALRRRTQHSDERPSTSSTRAGDSPRMLIGSNVYLRLGFEVG